jgi:hypothetical protein
VALAYVVAPFNNTLDVIDTVKAVMICPDCGVVATIPVGFALFGVAITSDGTWRDRDARYRGPHRLKT